MTVLAPPRLEMVPTDGIITLVDRELETWVVRWEPSDIESVTDESRIALASAVTQSLGTAVPGLIDALKGVGGLRVVFSPAVRKALAAGTYRLMDTTAGVAPMAIDKSGRIVEVAKVPASALVTAGGALPMAGLLAVSWPLALATGVAVAAAWAEWRWLDRTFSTLRGSLDRIETRLRDDDLGRLEAADDLVTILAPDLKWGNASSQLRGELTAARQSTESIYLARRRWVNRFKVRIELAQTETERKRGKTEVWAGRVKRELTEDSGAFADELVVFLHAMVTRARVSAATASVMAHEGAAMSALRLLDHVEESTRADYHDLHNRLRALDRTPPEAGWWQFMKRDDFEESHDLVNRLNEAMESSVGDVLPDRDEELVLDDRDIAA